LLVPDKEGPNFAVTAEADTAEEALSLRDDYAQLVTAWQIDG
jgi:hypothetical protein